VRAGAGFTIANQAQHVPNCDHFDCHAAMLLPENSQLLIHACCGTHTVDPLQQEWLHLDTQLDRLQPHLHMLSVASTSVAGDDSSLQLQATTRHFSHPRQLQGIPYRVGAGRGICVPQEKPCWSHSIAIHIAVLGGGRQQQDQWHK
jgi:hypothetical protein